MPGRELRNNKIFRAVITKHPHLEPIGEHLLKVPERSINELYIMGKIGQGGEIDSRVKGLTPDSVIPMDSQGVNKLKVGGKMTFNNEQFVVGAKIGFLVPESKEHGSFLKTHWVVYLFKPERMKSQ